jgi:hypothetical protein
LPKQGKKKVTPSSWATTVDFHPRPAWSGQTRILEPA